MYIAHVAVHTMTGLRPTALVLRCKKACAPTDGRPAEAVQLQLAAGAQLSLQKPYMSSQPAHDLKAGDLSPAHLAGIGGQR